MTPPPTEPAPANPKSISVALSVETPETVGWETESTAFERVSDAFVSQGDDVFAPFTPQAITAAQSIVFRYVKVILMELDAAGAEAHHTERKSLESGTDNVLVENLLLQVKPPPVTPVTSVAAERKFDELSTSTMSLF